jgi:hypothetical protein
MLETLIMSSLTARGGVEVMLKALGNGILRRVGEDGGRALIMRFGQWP